MDAWSLSARRAWIEMVISTLADVLAQRRSPQGERGLKSVVAAHIKADQDVALRKESVD